ncbi:MAG: YdiU family protein [Planctomycetota bacterium]|nr:YdiU family protein [Planctomycetota bacterium]
MKAIQFDNSYARLPEAFYSLGKPKGAPAPGLLRVNMELSTQLGLDAEWLGSDAGVAMLSGNAFPEGAQPLAMAYAGHQFGGFSAQLGDGRALLLGEVLDPQGQRWDVQLKGSGRTRYSRGGDGKATVAAIVREYLLSEGMFALGIPTTRALAAVTTGETIWREEGHLPGAILCRVAQSHVRVGTFQYFAARGESESVQRLADYVIDRHYPEVRGAQGNVYVSLLESIVARHASLAARWMQMGFIHGVMNTDNLQIVAETLDYGPCAFMDDFRPGCVFSAIDSRGRYAWDQQPNMAHWGMIRLTESLAHLLSEDREELQAIANQASDKFSQCFEREFLGGFRRKFGLLEPMDDDSEFVQAAFTAMTRNEVDYNLFFRRLTQVADGANPEPFESLFEFGGEAQAWLSKWKERIAKESAPGTDRAATMQAVNPIFIPRNHLVEDAIQHANAGNFDPFHKLTEILSKPFTEQPENESYERAPLENEKVQHTHCNT